MRKLEKILKYILIEYPGTKAKKFLTRMTPPPTSKVFTKKALSH